MRPILLQLAHRLLKTKDMRDLCHTPDRFYLWLDVLLEADLMDEAEALTKDELCKLMCEASLSCDELRRKVVQKRGLWEQEGKLAKERIQEKA
jgi:N-terminal acetyltransferase B complex non-catalytic subunit